MSRSKDKRIKKYRKNRIWLSFVGLIILSIIVSVLMIVLAYTSFTDIVIRKLDEGNIYADKVVEIYETHKTEALSVDEKAEQYVVEDGELLSFEWQNYTEYMDVIGGICFFDAEGNCVWENVEETPDLSEIGNLQVYEFQYRDSEISYDMILDDHNLLTWEDGHIYINDEMLIVGESQYVFSNISQSSFRTGTVLETSSVWFVKTVDEGKICVNYYVNIYGYEVVLFLLLLAFVLIIVLVFTLYYLITLIAMAVNQRRMTTLLYTDMVTGGSNWLFFVRKGTRLLKMNWRNKQKYAMIHLRMEKYRSFCTCFGVKEGEELLERFYASLKKQLKFRETMAHHEMADFGLLLVYTDKDELEKRIHDIEENLNALVPNVKLYFACGVCFVAPKETDIEMLYNNAFTARGLIEEDAESNIAFFDEEMNKQQLWERRVEDDMERALANKEFKVYLQPKYSAKEEQCAGAEALVRWIHPTDGFIPPNKFIPIFEKNGFILQLDDYMIEEVACQQAKWIAEGKAVVPISVNVSRAHFTREDLAEHICSIVDKYHVPHKVIELELTESAFFDDKDVLLKTVDRLREYGFIVSMDDFGAGYSSLNSLKELNIDVLKIDADFFRGAETAERGMLIVSEVIDLAKKLDMKIVAEGIESREQVDFLAGQECDLIQGYYFAKPMPIDEFEKVYE